MFVRDPRTREPGMSPDPTDSRDERTGPNASDRRTGVRGRAVGVGGGRPGPDGSPRPPEGLTRWPYAVLAYLFTGLALIGVVVPGLPTFPFLLLAAWAATRGSKRLHDWLYEHPRFGAALVEWEQERAVSRRSKVLAVGLMALSWLILLWRVGDPWVLTGLAVLFVVVGTYVVRRPEPSRSLSGPDDPQPDDP